MLNEHHRNIYFLSSNSSATRHTLRLTKVPQEVGHRRCERALMECSLEICKRSLSQYKGHRVLKSEGTEHTKCTHADCFWDYVALL